jgi:hypothetical protein
MERAFAREGMTHSFSGLIASGLAVALLLAGGMVAIHLEHATLSSTAPRLFPLKNQGLAFQRVAACAPDVLPLYGSSELLVPPAKAKASTFFALRQEVSRFRRLSLTLSTRISLEKGWMFYDRALDDFFHERVPRS